MTNIDRIFGTVPSWLCIQLKATPKLRADPCKLSHRGLSDHAPLSLTFSVRPMLPTENRPIQKWVFENRRFSEILSPLVKAADLDSLPAPTRLQKHKELLKEAARAVKDEEFSGKELAPEALEEAFHSCARAVAHNRIKLAQARIATNCIFAKHLTCRAIKFFYLIQKPPTMNLLRQRELPTESGNPPLSLLKSLPQLWPEPRQRNYEQIFKD